MAHFGWVLRTSRLWMVGKTSRESPENKAKARMAQTMLYLSHDNNAYFSQPEESVALRLLHHGAGKKSHHYPSF
jgi:hypothetical protein